MQTKPKTDTVVRAKRILLVEDESSVRATFRLLLELDGHLVTEASNGIEALDLFNKGQFDLVMTDFEMPGMKGNSLALSIKGVAPRQPVLMVTAYGGKVVNLDNPVDAILNKPFTMADLRCALARLLTNTDSPERRNGN